MKSSEAARVFPFVSAITRRSNGQERNNEPPARLASPAWVASAKSVNTGPWAMFLGKVVSYFSQGRHEHGPCYM